MNPHSKQVRLGFLILMSFVVVSAANAGPRRFQRSATPIWKDATPQALKGKVIVTADRRRDHDSTWVLTSQTPAVGEAGARQFKMAELELVKLSATLEVEQTIFLKDVKSEVNGDPETKLSELWPSVNEGILLSVGHNGKIDLVFSNEGPVIMALKSKDGGLSWETDWLSESFFFMGDNVGKPMDLDCLPQAGKCALLTEKGIWQREGFDSDWQRKSMNLHLLGNSFDFGSSVEGINRINMQRKRFKRIQIIGEKIIVAGELHGFEGFGNSGGYFKESRNGSMSIIELPEEFDFKNSVPDGAFVLELENSRVSGMVFPEPLVIQDLVVPEGGSSQWFVGGESVVSQHTAGTGNACTSCHDPKNPRNDPLLGNGPPAGALKTGSGIVYVGAFGGGVEARKLNTGTTRDLKSLAFSGPKRGFAVGGGGTILATINGETFEQERTAIQADLIKILLGQINELMAFSSGSIFTNFLAEDISPIAPTLTLAISPSGPVMLGSTMELLVEVGDENGLEDLNSHCGLDLSSLGLVIQEIERVSNQCRLEFILPNSVVAGKYEVQASIKDKSGLTTSGTQTIVVKEGGTAPSIEVAGVPEFIFDRMRNPIELTATITAPDGHENLHSVCVVNISRGRITTSFFGDENSGFNQTSNAVFFSDDGKEARFQRTDSQCVMKFGIFLRDGENLEPLSISVLVRDARGFEARKEFFLEVKKPKPKVQKADFWLEDELYPGQAVKFKASIYSEVSYNYYQEIKCAINMNSLEMKSSSIFSNTFRSSDYCYVEIELDGSQKAGTYEVLAEITDDAGDVAVLAIPFTISGSNAPPEIYLNTNQKSELNFLLKHYPNITTVSFYANLNDLNGQSDLEGNCELDAKSLGIMEKVSVPIRKDYYYYDPFCSWDFDLPAEIEPGVKEIVFAVRDKGGAETLQTYLFQVGNMGENPLQMEIVPSKITSSTKEITIHAKFEDNDFEFQVSHCYFYLKGKDGEFVLRSSYGKYNNYFDYYHVGNCDFYLSGMDLNLGVGKYDYKIVMSIGGFGIENRFVDYVGPVQTFEIHSDDPKGDRICIALEVSTCKREDQLERAATPLVGIDIVKKADASSCLLPSVSTTESLGDGRQQLCFYPSLCEDKTDLLVEGLSRPFARNQQNAFACLKDMDPKTLVDGAVIQCELPTADCADPNKDGKVNLTDFGLLKQQFNKQGGVSGSLTADLNGDGKVNLLDFGLLKKAFGLRVD